jgi:uncharacterized glyoxalase superfamily protein PhnB
MKTITTNLIVDRIEDQLPFWVDRLGFKKTVEVPAESGLGFAILVHGEVEIMLQTRASLSGDIPGAAGDSYRAFLYVHVEDLAPIRKALAGWPEIMPERTTFYGARELLVRDPAGNPVIFSKVDGA